ncbi:hypothetical protein JQX13_07090 [Archangium violaceum]|uniref:hypothetical protein n=1 Tax=Archangium violaceum TaxID=83451 RepID=UPI00193AF44F|nr:hypothetical protein [Archangium violaceum]QRK09867.1 hypothetical protein JQX13_07090 [Archangium violaceum]
MTGVDEVSVVRGGEAVPAAPTAAFSCLGRHLGRSWATRSLAVGGVATVLDILTLLACVKLAGLPTPVGAGLGPQVLRYGAATGSAMLVHAVLVGWLADRVGVLVVLAKLAADVAVFTVGQLRLLRYVVFPRSAPRPRPRPPGFSGGRKET